MLKEKLLNRDKNDIYLRTRYFSIVLKIEGGLNKLRMLICFSGYNKILETHKEIRSTKK